MRGAWLFSVSRQIMREPSSVRIWFSFLDQRSRRRRGTAFLAALTSQQILGLRVRQAKPLATALVVDLAGWHRDVTEELTSFRSEEHTSELQSLMRISYAVFCLKKKKNIKRRTSNYRYREHKYT